MKTTINQRGEYGRGCAPNILCIISRHYLLCPLCPLLPSPSLCTHGSRDFASRSNYDRLPPALSISTPPPPPFVRIQAQKPMSENNESMMRTEKRELFRILSRNEKVFNFQCLCTKEWNTSWQDVGEIRYIESGCLSTRFGRVTRPERREDVVILLRTLPTSSGSRHVQAGSSRWIVLLSYNRGQRPDTGRILSAGPRFTPLLCHSVCRETRNKRLE